MSVETTTAVPAPPTPARLRIDFLFLDLTTCTRCRGTDRSLGEARRAVEQVLDGAGIEVEVNKLQVVSEDQARVLRFVSSPTIRINGRDIAPELRESPCGSQACSDGCGDQIACRVWMYRGQEYTEPPVAMIVDAILRHVYGTAAEPAPTPGYVVPENLRRLFARRAAAGRTEPLVSGTQPADRVHCPAAEHSACCDTAVKQDCCGAAEDSCGCR